MHIRGLTQPSSILRPADMSDADRPAHAMSTYTHQPIDMLAPPPHRATPQRGHRTGLHLSVHGIGLGTPVLPAAGPSRSHHCPHRRHPQGYPGGTHCNPFACRGLGKGPGGSPQPRMDSDSPQRNAPGLPHWASGHPPLPIVGSQRSIRAPAEHSSHHLYQ